MFYWIVYMILYLPLRLFYPTRVINKKYLPKSKSIYACNHQTNLDVLILALCFHRRVYALGKAELYKNKFTSWFLNGIGCIKVNRGKADIEAVKRVLTVLKKENKPLIIFPTGTRNSSPDEVQDIKNGVAMFSLKAQAPIIPMVMIKKPKFLRFNKIVVGEPLDLTKYEGRPVNKDLYDEISNDLVLAMENLIKQNTKKVK